MKTNVVNVAVLLTCYNRRDTTLRCLRQLFAQKLPDGVRLDVYLVDDASPDKTGDAVKSEFPSVNVIKGSGSLFWCKGMRLAWDTAIRAGKAYDFYLWLNDDVQFTEGAMETLFADYDEVVAKIGAPVLIVGAFAQSSNDTRAVYGLWNKQLEIVQPDGHPHWEDGEVMNGNLVLVPKTIYEKIGPIYDGYVHGFGDADYRMMAERAGFKACSSSCLMGVCPRTPEHYLDISKQSFLRRVMSLFVVRFGYAGANVANAFRFRYRYWGLVRALASSLHCIFTILFPRKNKGTRSSS